jgi:hypothetical protein
MATTKTLKAQSGKPKFHGLVPLIFFLVLMVIAMIVLKLLLK